MNPTPHGRRSRSLVALLLALFTTLSVWQPTAATAAEIAPNLLSLERTSGDVLADGDEVVLAFEFDAPVDQVSVTLHDGLGGQRYLHADGIGAPSGELRTAIDTATWPGGTATFAGITYRWTAGGREHWVDLDTEGGVAWSSDGLEPIPPATDALRLAPFEVQSDIDSATPPTLLSAVRLSGDTVVDGDRVEIAWEFDRPVESIAFTMRDSAGREHRVQWDAWSEFPGEPATAGIAGVRVDAPGWAGGEMALAKVDYAWSGGFMALDASGAVISKYPEGLHDATLPEGGLSHLEFIVLSDFEPVATPRLTSLTRSSADVARDGDEIVLDWTVDGVVDSISVVLRDALGTEHRAYSTSWGPSDSGQVSTYVDATQWAAGPVELERVVYSWAAGGDTWATVELDASGEVVWSWGVEGEVPSSAGAIAYEPFEFESDVDLSVPPTLTSIERRSAEVLVEGERVEVGWSFDRPVDSVSVLFLDSRGVEHSADWSVWEDGSAAATEGIADAVIDTTRWAGGPVAFNGIRYEWGSASMLFDAAGNLLSKRPVGVQDTTMPTAGLDGLDFSVESDIDLTAVPSLTSVTRLSADTLHDGEDAAIAWEFDRPVQWVSFQFEDGLGRAQSVMWSGHPSTSGVSSILFEGRHWAPGPVELLDVRYSGIGDTSAVLARDGSVVSTWPGSTDQVVAYEPGFAALEFEVETDAVFETVDVPAPVFTDATCHGPAHLLLEDFPNGHWSWGPTGSQGSDGGQSHDGVPPGLDGSGSFSVVALFDDGWGTTGQVRWTHDYADPGSCEPLLELTTTPAPTIEGDPLVGEILTAAPGAWEPAPVDLSFQWLRDGAPISGATEPAYEPNSADVGASISVEVTGTKAGYEAATRSSEPVTISEPGPAVTRLASEGRYGSSAVASAHRWDPGVDVAYIVNGSDDVSAVMGAALGGSVDAPVLPVASETVPGEIAAELRRMSPKRIVVIGDDALVSDAVVDALGGYTEGTVDRLTGDGPFGLAAALSAHAWEPGVATAYVVDPADKGAAFAGAALAGATDAALVAVEAGSVSPASAAELGRLAPARVVVIGGADAVSDAVVDELADLTGVEVDRIDPGGRFTGPATVSAAAGPAGAEVVYVVNGADSASALAGAVLAGGADGALVAVKKSTVPAETADEIRRLDPRRIVVLGDERAVDGSVLAELEALIG